MKQLQQLSYSNTVMSSLELVELINQIRKQDEIENGESSRQYVELRHDHFISKIANHPGIDGPKFRGVYLGGNGQDRPCYYLPKREAYLMVMSESLSVQTAVYDRWQELEQEKAASQFVIPTTLSGALRLAAEQAEIIEVQAAQIAAAAPAIAFVDRYVESDTGAMGFREVCKLLKAKEPEFRAFLHEKTIMYKLGGNWAPYAAHIDAGRFEVKTGTANEHAYTQSKFTAKGVKWVAGEWAKFQLETTQ